MTDLASIADTAGAVPLDIVAAGVAPDDTGPPPTMSPKASPFNLAVDALWAGGYTVVPGVPQGKAPGDFRGSLENGSWGLMTAWNDYAHARPHESMLARWRTWPDANIGVVLGGDHQGYQLIAIDFDTDRDDELELLASSIPPSPMKKAGSRGFTAFYRANKDVRTKRYMVPAPTADKPNAKRTLLEILTGNAPRQTIMPPSRHPHGRDYEYITGNGVVPIHKLPVLTQDHFDVLEDNLSHLGWNGDDIERVDRATRGAPADDDNIWRETNDTAVANLDAWVGALGLPKLKRHGNGSWEAIPSFRASGSGQELMARKSNLKFHRTGIRDMGTDIGYTAIDVVVAAFSWDFDSAFQWLRGKLGLKGEDDSFFALPEPPTPVPVAQLEEADDGSLVDRSTGEVIEAEAQKTLVELPNHLTLVPGLLGVIIDFIEASARRPNRVLSFAAALTILGTLIGRRDAGPTKSGTHLYTLALAVSGAGKQHGLDAILALLMAAGAARLIGSSEPMSQTALVNQITKQPLSLSPVDEFGAVLARINAPSAGAHDKGIKKVMRSVYNASFKPAPMPSWANAESQIVASPAFSLYGVSTPAEFFRAVQGDDIVNGMLNRFLLLATNKKTKEVEPTESLEEIPEHLATKLRHIYQVRRDDLLTANNGLPQDTPEESGAIKLVVPWGPGAQEIYRVFAEECEERADDNADMRPFLARTVEMAIRLATIRAVGIDPDNPVVSAPDMDWGCQVTRWSAERMADDAGDLLADNPYTAVNAKIISKLKQTNGMPVKERDLQRATGVRGNDFRNHLKDLSDMGRILPCEVQKNGQVSKAWRVVANDNTKPARKR